MEEKARLTMERNGFIGKLYQPKEPAFPGKALVLFSGSDGRFELLLLHPLSHLRILQA